MSGIGSENNVQPIIQAAEIPKIESNINVSIYLNRQLAKTIDSYAKIMSSLHLSKPNRPGMIKHMISTYQTIFAAEDLERLQEYDEAQRKIHIGISTFDLFVELKKEAHRAMRARLDQECNKLYDISKKIAGGEVYERLANRKF